MSREAHLWNPRNISHYLNIFVEKKTFKRDRHYLRYDPDFPLNGGMKDDRCFRICGKYLSEIYVFFFYFCSVCVFPFSSLLVVNLRMCLIFVFVLCFVACAFELTQTSCQNDNQNDDRYRHADQYQEQFL